MTGKRRLSDVLADEARRMRPSEAEMRMYQRIAQSSEARMARELMASPITPIMMKEARRAAALLDMINPAIEERESEAPAPMREARGESPHVEAQPAAAGPQKKRVQLDGQLKRHLLEWLRGQEPRAKKGEALAECIRRFPDHNIGESFKRVWRDIPTDLKRGPGKPSDA